MIDGLGPEASKLMREAHRDAPTYPQRTRMWEAIDQSVTSHGVRFAEPIDCYCAIKHTWKGCKGSMGYVIGKALVNFIRNNHNLWNDENEVIRVIIIIISNTS
jgi:hypothetical protein